MAKLEGLLGISLRAGQAIFGEDSCMKALRGNQCDALVMDEAISDTVRRKYEGVCERAGTVCSVLPEGTIENATGKPGMAMAIRKGSLGKQIADLLRQN